MNLRGVSARQDVAPGGRSGELMRQILQRPQGRLAIAGASLVVVLLVITGGAFLLTGGVGGDSGHRPLTLPTVAPSKDGTVFTIDRAGSEARFTIHEVLLGQPGTVVGRTNQVAGQILVDQQHPLQSQVGEIRIDLSALTTDNGLRNRTLWNNILQVNQPADQFANFLPSRLSGLPASITVGQPFSFQITGALTIHQVTRSETFQVQVTPVSARLIKGTAQTTVRYEDFGLSVPRPPMVAKVYDDVVLALSFTAHP
jgi:polyisoprenoid-binding protein YceI